MSYVHKLGTSEIMQEARNDAASPVICRRGALKAAGTAMAGAADAGLLGDRPAHAGTVKEYLNILATGEALFVTFYSQAVAKHQELDLHGPALNAIKAILAEEQLHYDLAVRLGGSPATTHFSFPDGHDTFKQRHLFLKTQQLAEELTNGALLAWINDWAALKVPRLAQLGGQLMQVEGGHRVVGRVILEAKPWDDWAFGPISPELKTFLDVPGVVAKAGFLSPTPGNDFKFEPVNPDFPGVINTTPGHLWS